MNKVLITGIVLIVLAIVLMTVQITADFAVSDFFSRIFFSSYTAVSDTPASELDPLFFNFDIYFAFFMFVVFIIGLIFLIVGFVIRRKRR
jgi:hypothetical protein